MLAHRVLRVARPAARFRVLSDSAPPLTKIVATIGPASEQFEPLQACVAAGFSVMRLNFSHATPEEFFLRVTNLAKSDGGEYVATLLDTRGPEVRLGGLAVCKTDGRKATVDLVEGASLTLTSDPAFDGAGDAATMFVNYAPLSDAVAVGQEILLDDGAVVVEVTAVAAGAVETVVRNSNALGERKGVNLPGVKLGLPALSAKDEADVAFGVANGGRPEPAIRRFFVASTRLGDGRTLGSERERERETPVARRPR